MAKSKSTRPAKSPAKNKAKHEISEREVSRVFQPDKAAARSAGAFSNEEIGHVAGEVWVVLSRDGGMTIASLKKSVAAPSDLVMAAVGWLAREGKVELSSQGRGAKISLR